ncbi:MFS transporter [Streptomyces thermoviolaceus]|uniref:MFS transporter n=1 Tax=Streptomyces thermoviolaceus TaxID=1952 RepID=UPI0034D5123D
MTMSRPRRLWHSSTASRSVEPTAGLSRNRQILWLTAEGLSIAGDHVFYLALGWIAVSRYGPSGLGWILAAGALPRGILMLIGGAFADRVGPLRLTILSDISRAATLATLCALIWANGPSFPLLIVLAVIFGLADAIYYPASGSLPSLFVPSDQVVRIQNVRNLLNRLALKAVPQSDRALMRVRSGDQRDPVYAGLPCRRISGDPSVKRAQVRRLRIAGQPLVTGAPLGGVLVAWAGPTLPFLLDAATFLLCVIALLACRSHALRVAPSVDKHVESRGSGVLADLRSGLSYVRRRPALKAVPQSDRALMRVRSGDQRDPVYAGLPCRRISGDPSVKRAQVRRLRIAGQPLDVVSFGGLARCVEHDESCRAVGAG